MDSIIEGSGNYVNPSNYCFVISKNENYTKETHNGFDVLKINVVPDDEIYFVSIEYLRRSFFMNELYEDIKNKLR